MILAAVTTLITMGLLDAIWLTTMVPRIYQPQLGDLLAERPNLAVAGVFYLLYLVGVLVFRLTEFRPGAVEHRRMSRQGFRQ